MGVVLLWRLDGAMEALPDGRCVDVNVGAEILEWRRKRAVPFLLRPCAMCEM